MHFKKLKPFIIILLLLIAFIFTSAISYTKAVSQDISQNLFRLHVVANSDSDIDQNLKYKVRDAVLSYINELTKDLTTKEEVIEITSNHLSDIEKIALQTIENNGFNYTVKIQINNFYFPTKVYGDISLPAGNYDALKIEIGEAKGQNWWCVMFPPLCFVDVTSGIVPDDSKRIMQDNLSEEEYNIISKNTTDVKIKFKIIEVLQNLTISGIFM